ncbi:MAG: hypothetical protein V4503_01510 [Gemmatimonadota bacterium]
MGNTIVWAVLTAVVTGAVWTGIAVFSRQRVLIQRQAELLAEMEQRLLRLEDVGERLEGAEERLGFAERVLQTDRVPERLPPDA